MGAVEAAGRRVVRANKLRPREERAEDKVTGRLRDEELGVVEEAADGSCCDSGG